MNRVYRGKGNDRWASSSSGWRRGQTEGKSGNGAELLWTENNRAGWNLHCILSRDRGTCWEECGQPRWKEAASNQCGADLVPSRSLGGGDGSPEVRLLIRMTVPRLHSSTVRSRSRRPPADQSDFINRPSGAVWPCPLAPPGNSVLVAQDQ
ncbi:hypothetical protein AAFF_G00438240 [Aldrovandia affinis]|uniref:Uncharacterized protein n=1 Tax=Aldrovandia affinis TaxID=143900 RepID=A0AAD7S856_9TELE|nr:hypothetical protein AAFF_G00438240 [Aldrovandia affinis]